MNNLIRRNDNLKAKIKVYKYIIKKLKSLLNVRFYTKINRMEIKLYRLELNTKILPSKEFLNAYEKWIKDIEIEIDDLLEMIETMIKELKEKRLSVTKIKYLIHSTCCSVKKNKKMQVR